MYNLIGMGDQCPQSMALPTGYYVCPDCGAVLPIKAHCHAWDCPVDWRLAASRAARSILARMADQITNMQHWVISPPQDWFRDDDPVAMYEAVARMIRREMPEMAGVAILHPYRVRTRPADIVVLCPRMSVQVRQRRLDVLDVDVEDVAFDASCITSGMELHHGTWAALRERPDWQDFVYYSPHVHYVAAGYMLPSTQRRLRERGWVIKRVRRLRDADDVTGVLMYLWSHAIYVGRKKKQYRVCIGRRWRLRRLHMASCDDYVRCPSCGGCMRRVDADYQGWVADMPPAMVHRRWVVWRLQLRA